MVRPRGKNAQGNIGEASLAGYTQGKVVHGPQIGQGPGGVITPQILLGLVLVWSQQNYLRLLKTVRHFESS